MNHLRYTLLILAGCAVLGGCSKSDSESPDKGPVAREAELPMVEVGVAHTKSVNQTKVYTANVEANNTNNISPASPNRIKTINVEEGDHVKRGQVLVTLDSSAADQLKVRLDNAEREYQRALQLLEIGAGTRQSVDQLKTELDAARSQYDNMMENTILVSPITGVVTARNYDPGDMTGQLPVLTVGQLSPIVKAMINITENDLSLVKRGMPVEVAFDAFPDEVFSAKVSRIVPSVDVATRTFQAEVDIPNPSERILPGMFGRVSINLGSMDNVVVPDRAVVKQTGSGNRYVYVYKGGKVSYNKVTLGQRLGDSYELIEGVEDGDTVVIAGQTRLADGVNVQLLEK